MFNTTKKTDLIVKIIKLIVYKDLIVSNFPFIYDYSTSIIEHITWFRISVTAKTNNFTIIFYDTKKKIICAYHKIILPFMTYFNF